MMRRAAKRDGKAIPSMDDLFQMLAALDDMKCPVCLRKMNWFAKDGQATVMTLQHDRSGKMRFLCRSCNCRHWRFDGDSFYDEIGPDKMRCFCCKTVLSIEEFPPTSQSGKWRGRKSTCRPCVNKLWRERNARNRERYNERRRKDAAERRKRKLQDAAG
jgi:hypothetical protein